MRKYDKLKKIFLTGLKILRKEDMLKTNLI